MRDRQLSPDGVAAEDDGLVSVVPSATQEPPEAERQLVAAVERHREVSSSLNTPGRPQSGQQVAVKVLARAVPLVSFTRRRAAASGVPFERRVALTGWERDLVRTGLERLPEPRGVARLVPADVDPAPVVAAVTALEAVSDLR